MRLEQFAPLRAGEHVELLSVLGDGPAGDVDPLLLEESDQLLVAVGLAGILGVDELLDLLLDRLGGQLLTIVAADPGVEEVLELVDALRGMHVLVGGHAADGRLVHPDVVGDIAQVQRLQVLHAALEELLAVLAQQQRVVQAAAIANPIEATQKPTTPRKVRCEVEGPAIVGGS